MRPLRSFVGAAAVLLLAVGAPAWAADALVLGKKLLVKAPGSGEDSRTLIVLGKEGASDVSLANTPAPVAASLRVILNGASGTDETYALGAPGQWQPAGTGLKYSGGDPARLVLLKRSPSGTFTLKVKLKGNAGPADLASVPPNPGVSGGIILTVDQGSGPQVFCVAFGGMAGGTTAVNRSTLWKMLNPTAQPGCPTVESAPESTSGEPGAGGTVTTDGEADGATVDDPIETSVTTPTGGAVSIVEAPVSQPSPAGFELLGQQVDISAPAGSASAPLVLVFRVDASVIPPGRAAGSVELFRDGVRVAPCLGDPGLAFPDPCISERATVGDDLRITVLSTHASTWVLGLPLCGDGDLDAGETCDPPGVQAQCGAGTLCKTDCQCATACDCCTTGYELLEFTTDSGVGTCGTVVDSAGGVLRNLDCGKLYMGGGSSSYQQSAFFPDQVKLTMSVASCDATSELMTLAAATPAQTGSNRNCTAAGCLFGPPIPIPNPSVPVVSMCGAFGVVADASGSGTCGGTAEIALPLGVSLYLTGDLLPRRCVGGFTHGRRCNTLGADFLCDGGEGTCAPDPDVQPCPICNPISHVCNGGPNNDMPCTPATSSLGTTYPTSRDCSLSPLLLIGTVPIGMELTTGTAETTAVPSGTQQRVFCGYCRDTDGTGHFGSCAGGPNSGQTCGVSGDCPSGVCEPGPCESDADCTQPRERCEQRSEGAFGPTGGAAQTITLAGSAAACLAGGVSHPSTLAGGTCVAPSFNGISDAHFDVPAPAALSLPGDLRLAAPWCGNGMLNAGEACDPPGVQAQCGVGEICLSGCQCAALCGNGMLDAGEMCEPPGVQAECGAGEICTSGCQCPTQPVRIEPEFQVANPGQYPAVAAAGSGGFVVAWMGVGPLDNFGAIQAQRFSAIGSPVGAQFQANSYTTSYQVAAAVAAGAGGDFVVAWTSNGSSETDNDYGSIHGQRYDAAAVPQGGEFQVNTYTTNGQGGLTSGPSVAVDGFGRFVVVWPGAGSGDPLLGVFGQRYDDAGVPIGSEFRVNTYTTGLQSSPAVAADGSGNFVVVWDSAGGAGSDQDANSIQAQRYDANGVPVGGEFQVNSYSTSFQSGPAVATDPAGNFVVVWASLGSAGSDTSGTSIQGQRFESTGAPLGSEFQVNTFTTNNQRRPEVVANSTGDFAVVWESYGGTGPDADRSIQGRWYDATGASLGAQIQVNTYTTGQQTRQSISVDGSDNFVVVWDDGNSAIVRGQRFTLDATSITTTTTVTTTTSTTSTSSTVTTTTSTSISTTSTSTSTSSTSTSSSTVTTTSSTTSTTLLTCCGGNSFYSFAGSAAGGDCGDIVAASGTVVGNISCNGLYLGGGGNTVPLPVSWPDGTPTVFAITACGGGVTATLGATTSAATGSNTNCSSTGCLFGAPLAVPSSTTTPASVCIVRSLAAPATGSLDCATGSEQLTLPLAAAYYLTGDTATDPMGTIAGIQPCPLCSGGTCIGGSNNGMACTAQTSDLGDPYPTSTHCPPDPMFNIGTIPFDFALTTGTVTWSGTAATNDTGSTASSQTRVFAGYCRDTDVTGVFKSPAQQCWQNGMAVGPACSGQFESCEQRTQGAFGPNGGGVRTITAIGAPHGSLLSGPSSGTLATIFAVQPTFDPTVDGLADYPGPGAVAIGGTGRLCTTASACP